MIGLYILAQFLSTKTKLGRNIYAVGGGREAAFFAGINVKRYTFIAFVIAGVLASFSGVVLMSRLNSVAITNGQGYEFDAVIGSIIGGISLTGGKGKLVGTMFGSIFLITLFNGMAQLHVDPFMQDVLKGVVLVAAITMDVLRNRKRS
jgi:ribose/xylose/arabinose/galactoside ABC-type transport system permease subunit